MEKGFSCSLNKKFRPTCISQLSPTKGHFKMISSSHKVFSAFPRWKLLLSKRSYWSSRLVGLSSSAQHPPAWLKQRIWQSLAAFAPK